MLIRTIASNLSAIPKMAKKSSSVFPVLYPPEIKIESLSILSLKYERDYDNYRLKKELKLDSSQTPAGMLLSHFRYKRFLKKTLFSAVELLTKRHDLICEHFPLNARESFERVHSLYEKLYKAAQHYGDDFASQVAYEHFLFARKHSTDNELIHILENRFLTLEG